MPTTLPRLILIPCLAFLLTACSGLLFQPLTPHLRTPEVVNVKYRELEISSTDGTALHGWHLKAEEPRQGVLLYFHGNAENISTHFGNIHWLTQHGYDCLIFDYRGFGKSAGVAEIDGVIADSQAMLKYALTEKKDDEQLVVMGHSIGAALAIHTVAEIDDKNRIDALVSLSAFSDYRDIAQETLSRHWLTWLFQWPLSFLVSNPYDPIDSIAKVSPIPLLVMHSRDDRVIEFHHATRLYDIAQEPKQLIEIIDGHNDIFRSKSNRRLLLNYLESL